MANLSIYTSNDLATLADKLSNIMHTSPLDPLTNEIIIIQSEGMAYWLKLQLARTFGCIAGIDLIFPGNFCRELSSPTNATEFSQDILSWKIFFLLNDQELIAKHPRLKNYLSEKEQIKAIQLSRRLAALYDRYLIYRHDMLLAWENDEQIYPEHPDELWQAELWRALQDAPRASDFKYLLDNLNPNTLPARINVFGPSTLPPLFLRFMKMASEVVEVNIFVPTPTNEYFADIKSSKELLKLEDSVEQHYETGNKLLANLGRQGRDFLTEILEIDEGASLQELPRIKIEPKTALSVIQNDIENLQNPTTDKFLLKDNDTSLRVHSCHSALREVEVLRDQILDALDSDKSLNPGDILVMMSDVEKYAPWVRSVFTTTPELKSHFRISDSPVEDPASLAFLEILSLTSSRLEAEKILTLLDFAPIRKCANIEANELLEIRKWVEELNIRWGYDKKQRASLSATSMGQANSWKAGMERVLMGFAIGEAEELVDGVLPFTTDLDNDLSGRFLNWLTKIFNIYELISRPHKMEKWRKILHSISQDIIGIIALEDDDSEFFSLPKLDNDLPIQPEVIEDALKKSLTTSTKGGSFIGGRISFCAMRPMRTVPFKVVAVLGMNYEDFPKRNPKEGYDLTLSTPIRGDRSPREDDLQLFLEIILSAQKKLILSYTGSSGKDLSERPPSVCISELLDYADIAFITSTGKSGAEEISIKHRLQPCNPEYYKNGSQLFTYDKEYLPTTETTNNAQFIEVNQQLTPEPTTTIELDKLIDFWLNPAKAFCKETLNIHIPYSDEEIPEEEPITPEGLERFKIIDKMLATRVTGKSTIEEQNFFAATGELPPAELGVAWHSCLSSEVNAFYQKIVTFKPLPPAPFDLLIGQYHLTGTLTDLYTCGQVKHRLAKLSAKHIIPSWISHLLLCLLDLPIERFSHIIATDQEVTLTNIPDAQSILLSLIDIMQLGYTKPLCFFPRSSLAYCEQELALQAPKTRAKTSAIKKALDAWNGTNIFTGESTDPYFTLAFTGRTPLDEPSFIELANKFWTPYLNACEVKKC